MDPDAYVVGGAVRDRLSGRASSDVDVAVRAEPGALSRRLSEQVGARLVTLDARRGCFRLVPSQADTASMRWMDLTGYHGDVTADLRRRDFTIDAMAVPVEVWLSGAFPEGMVDPFGGAADLRRGVIRQTAEGSIAEDPVRGLRAIRLAAELGSWIEACTASRIREQALAIAHVSPERVREELFELFRRPGTGTALYAMDRLELLDAVFPELVPARGVAQPSGHYWDVFTHSLQAVEMADRLLQPEARTADPHLREIPWRAGTDAHLEELVADGQTRGGLLKVAALLHDVAKPETKSVEPDGRIRFLGHDDRGAELAEGILRRLRCSRRTIAHVRTMVEHHLRPTQISQGRTTPTTRAVFRFHRDLGDVALDTLYLNASDYLAARGPALEGADWKGYCRLIGDILSVGFEERRDSKPSLLLNGHDIQRHFAIPPGPVIGRLLGSLREAEATGRVQTVEEALELLGNDIAMRGSGPGSRG